MKTMLTVRNAEDFRAAAESYKQETADQVAHTEWERRDWLAPRPWTELDALVESVQGLELTVAEWHLMKWFISWDALDTLAAIITKARQQGVAA